MENNVDLATYFNSRLWNCFRSLGNYVVIPRTILHGMQEKWQENFSKIMDELRAAYDPKKIQNRYMVRLRGDKGRFIKDPLGDCRNPPDELPYRRKKGTEVTRLIEGIGADLIETKQACNVSDARRMASRIVGDGDK